jgi:hypothetical protein
LGGGQKSCNLPERELERRFSTSFLAAGRQVGVQLP